MTRKIVHAIIDASATLAQAHAVKSLLEGRGLQGVSQIPAFTVTEYLLQPGDRLEPVLPSGIEEASVTHVRELFASVNSVKSCGVMVSKASITCHVVRAQNSTTAN